MTAPLVVVGDALLDVDVHGRVERVCPDAPAPVLDAEAEHARPGGAALTALLAARTGRRPVTLVTALADPETDPDAARLLALLEGHVEVVALPAAGATPVKTRMLAGGRPLLRLDRGGLGEPDPSGDAGSRARAAIAAAGVLLVSDYGRGVAADPVLRAALARGTRGTPPLVWDPHPRGATPLPGAAAVTPNLAEARAACGPEEPEEHAEPAASAGSAGSEAPAASDAPGPVDPIALAAAAGRRLARRWDAAAVVVTVGEHGAVCARRDPAVPLTVPAAAPVPSATGDACGAGDRFAAALATALGDGADLADATADAAAAAGAFVAGGGAGAVRREPDGTWTVPGAAPAGDDPVEALLARVRARGGRVVATGGCFDLVHAGHARTLDAARELAGSDGAVVVCLNSDASVRRLKGPERPLVAAAERAELLHALRSVDAVVVFDEDDPRAVLDRLRPDLWVKGGDYAVDGLAETPLVRSWGGDVVTVAFHAGRSTTALAARLDPPRAAPVRGRPVLDPVGEPS